VRVVCSWYLSTLIKKQWLLVASLIEANNIFSLAQAHRVSKCNHSEIKELMVSKKDTNNQTQHSFSLVSEFGKLVVRIKSARENNQPPDF
jgi:hypothetical protein